MILLLLFSFYANNQQWEKYVLTVSEIHIFHSYNYLWYVSKVKYVPQMINKKKKY